MYKYNKIYNLKDWTKVAFYAVRCLLPTKNERIEPLGTGYHTCIMWYCVLSILSWYIMTGFYRVFNQTINNIIIIILYYN